MSRTAWQIRRDQAMTRTRYAKMTKQERKAWKDPSASKPLFPRPTVCPICQQKVSDLEKHYEDPCCQNTAVIGKNSRA